MDLKEKLNVGDEIEIEICPTEGEYAAETINGTPFVEKFSVEALQKVIENWKAEGSKDILCDIDHSSVETNDTIAAGWINSLFIDEDAKRLKGYLHLSQKGADLLNGLEYRYISPVLMFTEDNYPYYLDSASLTNTPRLQELRPVYNSKNFKVVKNEDGKPDEEKVNINEEKDFKLMEELKKLLGLPEEATDEDIKASVAELVEKVKAVAEEEAKAEADRLQAEAEEAVNACGGVEEDKKEEVVNCYKKDPTLVKTVLNCFVKKDLSKTVVNAQEAVKPELTDAQKLKAEFDKLPGGQAKVDFMLAHRGEIAL